MKTKYFGWKNSKVNCLMSDSDGGNWIQISIFKYWYLKICGFIIKKNNKGEKT